MALWYKSRLTGPSSPVSLAATAVRKTPQWAELNASLRTLGPIVMAQQVPYNTTTLLQYMPHGTVRLSYGLQGQVNTSHGMDVFADESERPVAVQSVLDRSVAVRGPYRMPDAAHVVIVRQPIFIQGVDATETFGLPDPASPLCGVACAYNATSQTAFWGFAAAWVDLDALAAEESSAVSMLRRDNFRFEVVVANSSSSPGVQVGAVIVSSGKPPRDPVEAPLVLPFSEWVVRVAPEDGWSGSHYQGLLAGVVVLAVVVSSALFAALVMWRRYQLLLEALLPKEVIRDLHQLNNKAGEAGLATRLPGMQAETVADTMLGLLESVLAGQMPALADVVQVQQALLRGKDVYEVVGLKQHMEAAHLDADVARNLMLQLGHTASSNLEYEYDDDGEGGWWGAEAGDVQGSAFSAKPSLTNASRHAQMAAAQNADCATLTGALALILTPQPAGWGPEPPGGASAYGVSASAAELASEANSDGAMHTTADTEAADAGRSSGYGMAGASPAAAAAAVQASGVNSGGQGSGAATLGGRIKNFIRASVPSLVQPINAANGAANGAANAGAGAGVASPPAPTSPGVAGGGPESNGPVLGLGGYRRRSLDAHSLQATSMLQAEASPPTVAGGVAAVAAASSSALTSPRSPVGARRFNSVAPDQQRQSSLSQAQLPRLTASEGVPLAGGSPAPSSGVGGTCAGATVPMLGSRDERPGVARAVIDGVRAGLSNGEATADPSSAPAPDGGLVGADVSGPLAPLRVNKVRRPPRRVASALPMLGQPSQQLRRRSLLLNAAAAAEHVGEHLPGGGAAGAGGAGGAGGGSPGVAALQVNSLRAASSRRLQAGLGALTTSNIEVPRLIIDGAPGAGTAGGGIVGGGVSEQSAAPGERLTDLGTPRNSRRSMLTMYQREDMPAASRRSLLGIGTGSLAAAQNRMAAQPPPPAIVEEVERILSKADSWQFDTWALKDATGGFPLSALGFYLIKRAGLVSRFHLKPVILARLLRHIESGYIDNPYHSATHAADVLQTLHVIVHGAQLQAHYLNPLGLLAAYMAAILHDYGHPGLTNDFLIATSDPLAVRYNDRSPLENHHAAASFAVMRRPELDALAPLTADQRKEFRKLVIEMILATDMKQHFALLSQFNTVHRLAAFKAAEHKVASPRGSRGQYTELQSVVVVPNHAPSGPSGGGAGGAGGSGDDHAAAAAPKPSDETERLLSLQLAIKVADLGHLGESLEVHKRWLAGLEEEFFRQGDKEKALGIPISPLFDRGKQGVSKSQVGFYEFVALPLAHALTSVFPGAAPLMRCFESNYMHWKAVDAAATAVPQAATAANSSAPATAAATSSSTGAAKRASAHGGMNSKP
ncbi:hypothetical protein HYH02_010474 [Chlamydomonas schloesseri]|uniref:Phosphodiesterase n=1 Tax=Chlamydomonas schloesseri TaxID=2026947 RepID=A0A835W433_9CHLO|nr:hypothetical protein HYH02_010474 [Chlamydomonas schloesseri]|eukprot:KAG2439842.1 hypothetical protein HYH02_010474 [Chlamydomonas schloesseri]